MLSFFINKCGHRNVLSKWQVWMSIFHIINFKLKKIHGHRGPGFFFNKKVILDNYFCSKSGPVFLFQRGRGAKVQNWPHILSKNNA
jgi:hypothetical protein